MEKDARHEVIDRGSAMLEMQRLASHSTIDKENAHALADALMSLIVKQLGWRDVADEYDRIQKWYA